MPLIFFFRSKTNFLLVQNLGFVLGPTAPPDPNSRGILAFNNAVQTLVPQQLPLSGMRSWKLFGYLTAALVFGTIELMQFLDLWAWAVDDQSSLGPSGGAPSGPPNGPSSAILVRAPDWPSGARKTIILKKLSAPKCQTSNQNLRFSIKLNVQNLVYLTFFLNLSSQFSQSLDVVLGPPGGGFGGPPSGGPPGFSGGPSDDKILNLADPPSGGALANSVVDDAFPHFKLAEQYQNFRSVIGLAWLVLVLMPFSAYLLGAQVKFFLSLHNWSGLPRWASFVLFLPMLIVVECILCWRMLLIDNLKQILVYGTIMNVPDVVKEFMRVSYKLIYAPIYGPLQAVLYCNYDKDETVPPDITGWWTFLGTGGVWEDMLYLLKKKISTKFTFSLQFHAKIVLFLLPKFKNFVLDFS